MQTNEQTNRQGKRQRLAKRNTNGEYLDRKTSIHSYRHRQTDRWTDRKKERQLSIKLQFQRKLTFKNILLKPFLIRNLQVDLKSSTVCLYKTPLAYPNARKQDFKPHSSIPRCQMLDSGESVCKRQTLQLNTGMCKNVCSIGLSLWMTMEHGTSKEGTVPLTCLIKHFTAVIIPH